MKKRLFGIIALALAWAAAPVHAEIVLFQAPDIIKAAAKDDVDAVRQLLMRGTNADTHDASGKTSLIIAATSGNLSLIDVLLDHGANLNATDKVGNTALMWAAERGDAAVVERLIEGGANVNKENRQGMTPLMAAARSGRLDAVRALLDAGARPEILDFTGRSARMWAQDGRNPRVVDVLAAAETR